MRYRHWKRRSAEKRINAGNRTKRWRTNELHRDGNIPIDKENECATEVDKGAIDTQKGEKGTAGTKRIELALVEEGIDFRR
jgi:hypothetical protein